MPVPSAWIRVPTSLDESIRSKRARSTLRILPFKGRIAWTSRLRPCLAEPPALSPSTRNSSDLAGSFSWQSASLPGSEAMPITLLRLASRALRAASRVAGILLEPFGHLVGHQAFERLAHLGADQFVLGLRAELGIGQFDRDDRGQPL